MSVKTSYDSVACRKVPTCSFGGKRPPSCSPPLANKGSLHILPSHWCPLARERLPDGHHEPRSTCHIGNKEFAELDSPMHSGEEVTKESDTILLATRHGIAWHCCGKDFGGPMKLGSSTDAKSTTMIPYNR